MKIKVSVPATSANVGSGFDALGLAVTLYNTVTFEESDKLDISAADGTPHPPQREQSGVPLGQGLFDKVGKKIPPLKIRADQPHPHWPGASVPPRPASLRACWARTGCWAMCSTPRSC